MDYKKRAGSYIQQNSGYKAFIPKPLPPDPEIEYDDELRELLSRADRAMARLDGVTTVIPNATWFIYIFIRKEALLSSQIEGTQATMEGVLEYESDLKYKENKDDLEEVFNYIDAMRYGLDRLKELPLSLRLFKEIHNKLLSGVRGGNKSPGEFRKSQNWIGPGNSSLNDAVFVPPPANLVTEKMGELENFLHKKDRIPPLIKISLAHAQFETIHPFLDGNGRLGRLLITFFLCWKNILLQPILYMSYYFKYNKIDYYDYLMEVRNKGSWEKWIKFFLKGIIETSNEGINTAKTIIELKERYENIILESDQKNKYSIFLLKTLFNKPYIRVKNIEEDFNLSYNAANNLIKHFVDVGILTETTGKERNRVYVFKEYMDIIIRNTI